MNRKKSKDEQRYAKRLGSWIRESRLAMDMSLEAFGELMNVHRNTVWSWESGKSIPNAYQYSHMRKIAFRGPGSSSGIAR